MPNPWNPKLLHKFHTTVELLRATRENLVRDVTYRDAYRLEEEAIGPYTMRFLDELQVADHVAFLAHAQEGAQAVSAVCVEERSDGLLLRLASNERPLPEVEMGLNMLLQDLCGGVQKGTSKDVHYQEVFKNVLKLSQHRIIQRIRPPWGRFVRQEQPLWERINTSLRIAGLELHSKDHDSLFSRLGELAGSMQRRLSQRHDDPELIEILDGIIKDCAAISYDSIHRSLEDQLRAIPGLLSLTTRRDIAQIDKLSRYYGAAKDLTKIARRPAYRPLFQSITLEILGAYSVQRPPGAAKKCHVHAEVQLVFHYEQHPAADRPSRAIGCSKSACFLCDALISSVGVYRISRAHRRLYRQWALPPAEWMTPQQGYRYRGIIEHMTQEMLELISTLRVSTSFRPFELESNAITPLTSELTLTGSSRMFSSRLATPRPCSVAAAPSSTHEDASMCGNLTSLELPAVPLIMPPSGTVSSISLSKSELPFRRHISATTSSLDLYIDGLWLFFDFKSFSVGRLTVKRVENSGSAADIMRFPVSEIPTSKDMEIGRPGASSLFKFQLQHTGDSVVEIEMFWGVCPGCEPDGKDSDAGRL